MRFGVQSHTWSPLAFDQQTPLAHGENAGRIQQRACCTKAGNFSRNPAPSAIDAAG
jgi:hypothetical protein